MELGKAKLRRNGINNLQNALHPGHGLIWTDGKGIYLAPVHLYRDQVENAGSLRLGEFEFVQSVHWSCTVDHDTCYMAAVHQQNVTVWRVNGAVPRLAFKQVRKINVQSIPQGCLWNPSCDVLCLLSRQQCSFYFRHTQNRGSFAFPALDHEKIMCGCWSPDGKRLVLCVGSALLIYTWADLEANIGDFVTAAWRIPGVSGNITAVVPASNNSLVCASDLPLDALCKNINADAFLLPGVGEAVGNDMKPKSHASMKDSLLNLQPNPLAQVCDTAMLSLVKFPAGLQDPTVLASATVPGLLSPDLLHFQTESQCVVVGSNAQSELQVFALLDNYLLPSGQLTLDKEQRPKGMCGLHTPEISSAYGVLVLVGTPEPSDPAFPSANNVAPFNLSLHFFATRPERARQLHNGHSADHSQSSSLLTKSESHREQRNKSISDSRLQTRQSSYKGERPDHRLRSPDGHSTSPDRQIKMSLARIDSVESVSQMVEEVDIDPSRRLLEGAQYSASRRLVVEEGQNTSSRRLVEEVNGAARDRSDSLETEKTDFSQTSPQFDNAKLSLKYEIGENGQDKSSTRQSRSTSKQDSPRRKELDKKERDKETSSKAAEVKSKPAVVSNGQGGASNPLVHAATGTVNSTSSSMHKEVKDKKSAHSSATNSSDTRGIVTINTPEITRPQTLSVDVRPVAASGNPQLSRGGMDGVGRLNVDDAGSVCSSFNSSDSNYEVLERQIQQQRDQIDALQQRLEELSVMVEDSACVFPVRYQNMSEPQVISIQCVVGGARVSRRFLLDNGRLQLEPLKQAFGLLTVELILDGEPLVLGANIDGYIPMKFSSGSVLQVTGIPISYSPKLPARGLSKDGPMC